MSNLDGAPGSDATIGNPDLGQAYNLGYAPLAGRIPAPDPESTGQMFNLLRGNMENRRDHVFRRVEAGPYSCLPKDKLPGWGFPAGNSPIPSEEAIKYAACGTKGSDRQADYTFNQICRGEVAGDPQSPPVRWETMGADKSTPSFCTHTLFPTKFTRTLGAKTDTFYMSYYCIYSSRPIAPPQGSWTPQYKDFSLEKDATIDGETDYRPVINVDMALLNDENAIVSVIASCQNAYALSGAYITFVPRIDNALFLTSTYWSHASRYTIGGASLGMAVFAAIKGWMPILYTGYLNAPMPGARFITNVDVREAMSKEKYGVGLFAPASYSFDNDGKQVSGQFATGYDDNPWYLNPDTSVTDAAQNQPVAPPIMSRYMAQPNFVETVGNIFSKLIYAVVQGIPIFIPMQSSFRTDLVTFVSRFRTNNKAIQWMGMVPTFYTAAQMEDGYPMLTRVEGQFDVVPNIIMPLTMTDASLLQLRLFNIIASRGTVRARIGTAGGPTRATQISMFQGARQNMIDIAANEYMANRARGAPERDRLQDERNLAEKEGWARGKTNRALDAIRAEFKTARATAKQQKATDNKIKATRVKEAVDKERASIKKKKEDIRDAKLKLRTDYRYINKPTDAEKATLRGALRAVPALPKSSKQQYAAKAFRDKMFSQKAKREADGTYSAETKADLKARRSANEARIRNNPEENPGQYTSQQRGAMRAMANRSMQENLANARSQIADQQVAIAALQAPQAATTEFGSPGAGRGAGRGAAGRGANAGRGRGANVTTNNTASGRFGGGIYDMQTGVNPWQAGGSANGFFPTPPPPPPIAGGTSIQNSAGYYPWQEGGTTSGKFGDTSGAAGGLFGTVGDVIDHLIDL